MVERKKSDIGANFGGAVGPEILSLGFHTDSSSTKNHKIHYVASKSSPSKGPGKYRILPRNIMAYDKLPEDYKKRLENLNGMFFVALEVLALTTLETEKRRDSKDNRKSERF